MNPDQDALSFFKYTDYRIEKNGCRGSHHIYVKGTFKSDLLKWNISSDKAFAKGENTLFKEASKQVKWIQKGSLIILSPHTSRSNAQSKKTGYSWPPAGTTDPMTCHKIYIASLKALQAADRAATDRSSNAQDEKSNSRRLENAKIGKQNEQNNAQDEKSNSHRPRSIERSNRRAMILQMLLSHSDYLLEHSLRCEALVKLMVRRFKSRFPNYLHQTSLAEAALAHDLGRVAIPNSLAAKDGKMTPWELYWMNRHPMIGLGPVAGSLGNPPHLTLWPIICHHLTAAHVFEIGKQLHASYRREVSYQRELNEFYAATTIIKLADAIDSRTSMRPYNQDKKRSLDTTLTELRDQLDIVKWNDRFAFPLPETYRPDFRRNLQKWLMHNKGEIEKVIRLQPLPKAYTIEWV